MDGSDLEGQEPKDEEPDAPGSDVSPPEPTPADPQASGMPEPPTPSPGIPERSNDPLPWGEWWPPQPATPSAPPTGSPPRRWRGVVAAVVAAFVLLSAGYGIGWKLSRDDRSGTTQVAQAPITALPTPNATGGQQLTTQAIAARVSPAVVDIETFFDPSALNGVSQGGGLSRRQGAATGMIITSNGEVLTNNHVVEGTTTLKITIQGRSGTYDATVVGVDPTDDVALIQIHGVSGLPTVTLGDSSGLNVGDRVVAIGNALGRGGTPAVTEGSVTALHQSITAGGADSGPETLKNLIQSDASISPGDSGGPLLNGSGQVIGMITAASRTRRLQPESTVGFAIPTNIALDIVNQIRTGQGSADVIIGQAGFLGVQVQELDAQTANRLGLSVSSGPLVVGVISGTPAARAGISKDSVITAINGQRIDSVDSLGSALHTHKPGDRVRVTWVDANGIHNATVALIGGPAV